MRIRIRETSRGGPPRIRVREKEVFFCKDCSNKYYSLLLYCPQCLGEVLPSQEQRATLKIVSIPEEKKADVAEFLRSLSGKRDFDFNKSLNNLPWNIFLDTDRATLQHWIEVFEALKTKAEIIATPKKGKRKLPAFESQAPLPFFLSESLRNGVRRVSIKIRKTPVHYKWVQSVLLAVKLIEGLHKQHLLQRVVFSDFLMRIERDLQILIQNVESGFANTEELEQEIEQFHNSVQEMMSSIEEVEKKVQEQM